MVNLANDLYLIMLEENWISYDDYIRKVPSHAIPPEYASVALFMRNKGKASRRLERSLH